MKELEQPIQDQGIEIVAEQEKKKEVRLIERQRRIPGLILWQYNAESNVLDRAKFKQDTLVLNTLDPQKLNGQGAGERALYKMIE